MPFLLGVAGRGAKEALLGSFLMLQFAGADTWDGMKAAEEGRQARWRATQEPGAAPGGPGDVPVTHHKRLTGEPAAVFKPHFDDGPLPPFFVDWLSISQVHPQELPVISAGLVQSVRGDGSLEWQVRRRFKHQGSFDTSIQITCDGHKVELRGNLSRFGRPDNLFGYDLAGALRKASEVCAAHGLPPFTSGRRFSVARPSRSGHQEAYQWTGARISRLDLTCNYSAGSEVDAHHYMRWLATQQHSRRIQVGTHGADGETVDFGRGSRRLYAKAYLKHVELARHGAPGELVEYCRAAGVVRFELTVKATQLISMGCEFLGGLHMGKLVHLFNERRAILSRADRAEDSLESLPRHLRATARDYLAGMDVAASISLATFKRHRRALLPHGIDIAVRSSVRQLPTRVRVIHLSDLPVPDWYSLPLVA